MLRLKDIQKAKKRKKMFRYLDFWPKNDKTYSTGFFKEHRSLSCGCSMCRFEAEEKRLKKKRIRIEGKQIVKNII